MCSIDGCEWYSFIEIGDVDVVFGVESEEDQFFGNDGNSMKSEAEEMVVEGMDEDDLDRDYYEESAPSCDQDEEDSVEGLGRFVEKLMLDG
jgi:hypothetical protein